MNLMILLMSDSMGEKFFIGAIQGIIGSIIVYFWLRYYNKKGKKQHEKSLKEEIYHDSSSLSNDSENIIEVEYYNTLYEELKERCNPANYMEPYNAEKVEISNYIFSQLDTNRNNIYELIKLRNYAIKKLGLSFSAKELYDKLSKIYNPNNFVGENYNADKLHVANQIYAKIQRNADDVVELENIAKEVRVVLNKRSLSDGNTLLAVNHESNPPKNTDEDYNSDNYVIYLVFAMLIIGIIVMAIVGGK